MRVVNGKSVCQMDRDELLAWVERYRETTVDLGAGDGRFVRHLARQHPDFGAVGVDLVAANPRHGSGGGAESALFVLADALALPDELREVATRLTINFPWGSLLRGLLSGDPGLLRGLEMAGASEATLDIVLNAGALAEAGWALETGGEQVATVLRDAGINVRGTSLLGQEELRRWPTTWAKRLAFGRDPRAMWIEAKLPRRDHVAQAVATRGGAERAGQRLAASVGRSDKTRTRILRS